MSSNKKVISGKDLPTRLPIFQTAVIYLMLDRFHAVGWVKGMAWTVVAILWIMAIYMICNEKHVELNELK